MPGLVIASGAAGAASDDQLLDRMRGALIGIAVGDGLGAPFEGRPGPIPPAALDRHLADTTPARYTDDTAMTIAVAQSMLHAGGLDLDHLARTFATSHAREPSRGYSSSTAALLRDVYAGADWQPRAVAQFHGLGSLGNGAAMRSAPFGLWTADPADAGRLAGSAATVTHTHPLAAVVADALGTGITALEAVPTAICAHLHHPTSVTETVRLAIGLGGDTDTIAAMAAAITGGTVGAAAIPEAWKQRCEGIRQLRELADRIHVRRH